MRIRVLTANDVGRCLSMQQAIEAMGSAFGQYSAGKATVPLRTRLNTDKGVSLVMPAFLHATKEMAVKIVSVYEQNPSRGLPTISAMVLVLDAETGFPVALINGESLTALRTGAAGGLAAELLSRPDSRTLALFGAGVQAGSQLEAVLEVRAIEKVIVVDPNIEAARRLADLAAQRANAPQVEIETDADRAAAAADIIAAATTATTPLFDGEAVRPGTHITGIGSFTPEMQEIDARVVRKALVVADSRQACLAEAGDIIAAGVQIDAEIGEIVNGSHPGRTSRSQITFFKSVGLAAQDAAAAVAILRNAERQDIGRVIEV